MKRQKLTEKNVALGKRIRRYRGRKGLSQEQLAEITHLTQTHISLLENGRRGISMTTLSRIASALGCKTKDPIPF